VELKRGVDAGCLAGFACLFVGFGACGLAVEFHLHVSLDVVAVFPALADARLELLLLFSIVIF
jgi:hypothetical protein